MTTFITTEDLRTRLSERIISLLIGDDYSIIDNAVEEAIGVISDRLSQKYSLATEFGNTGDGRNKSLLRWTLAITLYTLYARIPDEEVPERIIKDYDDTLRELELLQKGTIGCALTLKTDTDGETISRIRMGSNEPRSHNPFRYP